MKYIRKIELVELPVLLGFYINSIDTRLFITSFSYIRLLKTFYTKQDYQYPSLSIAEIS